MKHNKKDKVVLQHLLNELKLDAEELTQKLLAGQSLEVYDKLEQALNSKRG